MCDYSIQDPSINSAAKQNRPPPPSAGRETSENTSNLSQESTFDKPSWMPDPPKPTAVADGSLPKDWVQMRVRRNLSLK